MCVILKIILWALLFPFSINGSKQKRRAFQLETAAGEGERQTGRHCSRQMDLVLPSDRGQCDHAALSAGAINGAVWEAASDARRQTAARLKSQKIRSASTALWPQKTCVCVCAKHEWTEYHRCFCLPISHSLTHYYSLLNYWIQEIDFSRGMRFFVFLAKRKIKPEYLRLEYKSG